MKDTQTTPAINWWKDKDTNEKGSLLTKYFPGFEGNLYPAHVEGMFKLEITIPDKKETIEQAARVYYWDKTGNTFADSSRPDLVIGYVDGFNAANQFSTSVPVSDSIEDAISCFENMNHTVSLSPWQVVNILKEYTGINGTEDQRNIYREQGWDGAVLYQKAISYDGADDFNAPNKQQYLNSFK